MLVAMLNDRKKRYIKATFRQFLWSVFFLLSTFINSTVALGQKNTQLDNSSFDRQKWLTSSDYRYEVVKGSAFPNLDTLTKKQIIKILGQPDFKTKKRLTYCFDLPKENKKCKCSFLTIELDKKIPAKYRVAIVWFEPSIKKD